MPTCRTGFRFLVFFFNGMIMFFVHLARATAGRASCFVVFLIHIFELIKFLLIFRPYLIINYFNNSVSGCAATQENQNEPNGLMRSSVPSLFFSKRRTASISFSY